MYAHKLENKVAEYIKENKMADRGDGVLAAVSGGADSLCLLFLLDALKDGLGIRLYAFHLNHCLRGSEADGDEETVRRYCKELGVPLIAMRKDVAGYAGEHGLTAEEAGRELRYGYLYEMAGKLSCARIAVAHNRDDDAETVLMNLLRGSGLRGMGGIPATRDKIIRPLLDVPRREIEEYLNLRGIKWREDSTNRDNAYTRNKIRNVMLPWIAGEITPHAVEHILNVAALSREADRYFNGLAAGMFTGAALPTEVFDAQPPIVRRYLVRELLVRSGVGMKDISERHIRAVLGLTGPGGGTRISLGRGVTIERGYSEIVVKVAKKEAGQGGHAAPGTVSGKKGEALTEGHAAAGGMPGFTLRIFPWEDGLQIPREQYTKWLDYDKVENGLVLRSRRQGDFFLLPGGKRKTLRRYMIDEKIPADERDSLPLLADGSHIVWIIGRRISEAYKISDATKTVAEVKVTEGMVDGYVREGQRNDQ